MSFAHKEFPIHQPIFCPSPLSYPQGHKRKLRFLPERDSNASERISLNHSSNEANFLPIIVQFQIIARKSNSIICTHNRRGGGEEAKVENDLLAKEEYKGGAYGKYQRCRLAEHSASLNIYTAPTGFVQAAKLSWQGQQQQQQQQQQ
jgi:hypothetical protein